MKLHAAAAEHRIRFGDNPECVPVNEVEILTPIGNITFAVMPTNTPFLLCLADLDRLKAYVDNTDDTIIQDGRRYPLVRKWGHLWMMLNSGDTATQHFTEVEIRQLHRRFGHPAVERFCNLLTRAGYNDLDRSLIERINKYCHQCQMHGKAPGRFKFTLRDEVDFNARVIVDVMYINQRPVLHIVDEATGFQAARFLPTVTAEATWNALRAMRISISLASSTLPLV